MSAEVNEGGIRPQKGPFFIRETTRGEVPADPDWKRYSDTVENHPNWSPDASVEAQRGTGEYLPKEHYRGVESHAASVQYQLQQWFSDGAGTPVDASGDGMLRNSDNGAKNSHAYYNYETHATGGTAGGGRYIFYIGRGGLVDQVEIPFSAERALPINVTLSYEFELFEAFSVSQPASSTTLDIVSTDANDTGDVEIEAADGTSETVTLTGTTTVTTTTSFPSLTAIDPQFEQVGDITVADGSGNTLATVPGSTSFNGHDPSPGIPALGTGSFESALGTSYERFRDDTIEFSGGNPLAGTDSKFVSGSATISNNVDGDGVTGQRGRSLFMQEQTLEIDGELYGPEALAEPARAHLQNEGNDIVWTGDGGTLTWGDAKQTSSVEVSKETSQGRDTGAPTWSATTLTIATS